MPIRGSSETGNANSRLVKNNFDLLRTLFAAVVVLVHAPQLSNYPGIVWFADHLSSQVAVEAFFVVSGFLIFMSYERASSIRSYSAKRIRRIYPAYFTVVTACAVFFVFITSKGMGDYFSLAWLKYVAANLTFLNFLQPDLPGVFEHNKVTAVNGALWTLRIEAMFYISVPFFVYLFRKLPRLLVIASTYCMAIVYSTVLTRMAEGSGSPIYAELSRQLPGQLSYFMAGAFFYYYFPFFERRVAYFLAAAIIFLSVNCFYPVPPLEPIALATLVVFFGLFFYLGNFGKYGDFSYGIYILHYPIIQVFLLYGVYRDRPWLFLAAVVAATLAAAVAMWYLVEKRFLLRSSHYIAITEASGSVS